MRKSTVIASICALPLSLQSCGGGGSSAAAPDTMPNAFDITDVLNLAPSSIFTTNTITVSGLSVPVTATTTLGTLVINGVDTGLASATVKNDDTVAIAGTASALNATTLNGQITIGGLTDVYNIVTAALIDKTPNAFNVTDITNVVPSNVWTSNTITVAGLGTQVSVSTTLGTLIINGINTGLATSVVNNTDTVAITGTAPATNATTQTGSVTIGTLSDPFAVTTQAVINTAPTATAVTIDALAAASVTYNLNPNIADAQTPDSGLTITVGTAPANGTLSWVGHQFTYQANAGFTGTDTFTYFVVDPGTLQSAIRTVTINNIANNTAPTIGTPSSTGNLLFQNLTNITVPITDDNLALVTWTLSFISPSGVETGTFSTSTGTGNTLSGISFTPQFYGTGWTIQATIVDSGAGTTNVVTIYAN